MDWTIFQEYGLMLLRRVDDAIILFDKLDFYYVI